MNSADLPKQNRTLGIYMQAAAFGVSGTFVQGRARMRDAEVYAGAALLGALSGLRSMAAPAALGQLSQRGGLAGVTGPLALVTRPAFATTTKVLAVAELIADKLPVTPNRTAAGPLLGRAVTGAISGAILCSAYKKSSFAGALVGAACAIGAAYGAYELRKGAGQKWRVPDTYVALVEDAVVAALGVALTARLRAREEAPA